MMTWIRILFVYFILLFSLCATEEEAPTIRWGQSSTQLIMLLSFPSIQKESVIFGNNNLNISMTNKNGEHLDLNYELLRPIVPEKCSYDVLESGLKIRIHKKTMEPCWKRVTKENVKLNNFIKEKKLGDANSCELAKERWFMEYKFQKRKEHPEKVKRDFDLSNPIDKLLNDMRDSHANFSIHEY